MSFVSIFISDARWDQLVRSMFPRKPVVVADKTTGTENALNSAKESAAVQSDAIADNETLLSDSI